MSDDRSSPVMALNPYTGKLMNMEPVFRFLKEEGDEWESLDDVIKFISVIQFDEDDFYLLDNLKGRQDMFLYLYGLRNMLKELKTKKRQGVINHILFNVYEYICTSKKHDV